MYQFQRRKDTRKLQQQHFCRGLCGVRRLVHSIILHSLRYDDDDGDTALLLLLFVVVCFAVVYLTILVFNC